MATYTDGNRLLVASTEGGGETRAGINLHAIAPVIIGLSAPVIVMSLFSPSFLMHARFLVLASLGALFVVATALFCISVLSSGPLTALVVDRDLKRLDLVHAGLFANKANSIGFAEIAVLRLITVYDDDGYRFSAPELVLRNGVRMQLPIAMTQAEVNAARAAIGLVS